MNCFHMGRDFLGCSFCMLVVFKFPSLLFGSFSLSSSFLESSFGGSSGGELLLSECLTIVEDIG